MRLWTTRAYLDGGAETPRVDDAARKAVLRSFTYGLYVVTARHAGRRNAFTANWLTQVSFDPPLVALSVENDSVSLPLIREAGAFAVCVLHRGQREVAGTLGRSLARSPQKLDGMRWLDPAGNTPADGGMPPLLADCLGWVRCVLESTTPAGDSTLLIGRVMEAGVVAQGEPLTMREAGFRHSG
ncbi:MAG: flavin reductase family protein [Chloroflexota bacterium]